MSARLLGAIAFALIAVCGFLYFDDVQAFPQFPAAIRTSYFCLIGAFAAVLVLGAILGAYRPTLLTNRAVLLASAGIAAATGAALIYLLWDFDIDDKWGYYRLARMVLQTGEPLWNYGEMHAVAASYLWPYLVAPGAIGADPNFWDFFQKTVGIGCVLIATAIIWYRLEDLTLRILVTACLWLYAPLKVWSLGGLDTALATVWVILLVGIYLSRGPKSYLFWILAGMMMLIRPDGVLLGVGVFLCQFIRSPRDLLANVGRGLAFSLPILLFIGRNYLLSGVPMPLVFYVKGWNCVYCGSTGVAEDVYLGSHQLLSAIFASSAGFAVLIAGLLVLISCSRLRPTTWGLVWSERPFHLDLCVGLVMYLAYHVIGGYQHMGFTYRYFIPPLMGLVFVLGDLLDKAAPVIGNAEGVALKGRRLLQLYAPVLVAALTLQSAAEAVHLRHFGLAMTRSPKQDHFSVVSYRDYLASWHEAGLDLIPKVTRQTKMFLLQGMVTGSLTDAYLVDQFYFPSDRSSDPLIHDCLPLHDDPAGCSILYDYIITYKDPKIWPASHEVEREYATIVVMKRRHFPVPAAPANPVLENAGSSRTALKWQLSPNTIWYEVAIAPLDSEEGRTLRLPPSPPEHGFDNDAIASSRLRIRACNDAGCSDFSPWVSRAG